MAKSDVRKGRTIIRSVEFRGSTWIGHHAESRRSKFGSRRAGISDQQIVARKRRFSSWNRSRAARATGPSGRFGPRPTCRHHGCELISFALRPELDLRHNVIAVPHLHERRQKSAACQRQFSNFWAPRAMRLRHSLRVQDDSTAPALHESQIGPSVKCINYTIGDCRVAAWPLRAVQYRRCFFHNTDVACVVLSVSNSVQICSAAVALKRRPRVIGSMAAHIVMPWFCWIRLSWAGLPGACIAAFGDAGCRQIWKCCVLVEPVAAPSGRL